MTDDLVKLLRDVNPDGSGSARVDKICVDAADRIEEQAEEIIQLNNDIEYVMNRNKALEKALRFYECGCKQDSCTPEKPKFRNIRCGWIARAALAGGKKDGEAV